MKKLSFGYNIFLVAMSFAAGCNTAGRSTVTAADSTSLRPSVVTQKVNDDSDDPAIWINAADPASSLIVGTDKSPVNGGLFVFGLDGKIDTAKSITGLRRVNNVDVAYGLKMNGGPVDIAVLTERDRNSIRVFSLPDVKAIDGGGIEVFMGQQDRLPMGIALYTRPSDHQVFAIVGRKSGPAEGYLEQYQLEDDGKGQVTGRLVRRFGKYSGKKEIESICVDNELGYVYYSDEQVGIRKYYADPALGNEELAMFGQGQFKEDNEGISIYKFPDGTGYILVSDQSANTFNIYPREGKSGNKHLHERVAVVPVSTQQSDGSEVSSVTLPGFPGGLFVAMSEGGFFQLYSWKAIAEKAGLRIKN